MILAHKIRIDTTYKQEVYFRKACGTSRFTYNWALAEWKRQYESGLKPSSIALKKQFNAIKREQFPWTYDVHRDCTSQPFTNIQKAFNNFFRRVKEYVEEKHGLRLSGAAADILTEIVKQACDDAAVRAKIEKRLTIKDRDFQSV